MRIEDTAVELENVTFRFLEKGKRSILDHVSLSIPAGQITVLLGKSGCGKSTLAAVAAGLYPENGGILSGGHIRLFGKTVNRVADDGTVQCGMNPQERSRWLTMMFQNPDLQFCMKTLREELYFCMENICVPEGEMEGRAGRAAAAMGLTDLLDRPLYQLSGGEKQKASLCCLSVLDSRIILLDEAFANLDEQSSRELLEMLRSLAGAGKTIIAIDHRPELWMDTADEMIVLGEGGRVLKRGICRENLHEHLESLEKAGICIHHVSDDYFEEQKNAGGSGENVSENIGKTAENVLGNTGNISGRMSAGSSAIELQQVTIPREVIRGRFGRQSFGESLLEHTSIRFPAGKLTAVLGKSGSGKTTTFLSVLKQHPYSGTILVGGKDIRTVKSQALYRQIGIVFQNPANQFLTQNVRDEVEASIRVFNPGISEQDLHNRAEELLEAYGLKQFHRYSPYMLSQGQQRRLAVLSVLCGGQNILLLDEPTYGQDLENAEMILQMLRRRIEEEHLTVICITHDRQLAEKWADHICVLQDKHLREKR